MDEQATPAPKPGRARAASRPRAKGAQDGKRRCVGRRKRSLVLSDEAWLRLTVHAAALGLDRSEVVEGLVLDGCRRFVVHDRGGRAEAEGQAGAAPAA
jgi:hypothetical protein